MTARKDLEDDNGGGASQTTVPAAGSSTGTDVSLRDYFLALRRADERLEDARDRFDMERDRRYTELHHVDEIRALTLAEERDRRYSEVNIEKEKALKIKETADLAALDLAREIQQYKDEKANELRKQIESERGLYTTKDEHASLVKEIQNMVQPLQDFMIGSQGDRGRDERKDTHSQSLIGLWMVAAGLIVGVLTIAAILIANHV